MKVLCVTPAFPIHPEDQAGNYIWDSVKALLNQGIEVHVLVAQAWRPVINRKKRQLSDFPLLEKLQVLYYPSIPRCYVRVISNISCKLRIQQAVQKMIKEYHYDVVHIHTETPAIGAVSAARKFSIPSIVTIHGLETCQRYWGSQSKKMIFNCLNAASKIVLVGEPLRQFFEQGINYKHRICIIQNGFRAPREDCLLEKWPEKIRFISVSNLCEEKGIDINLKAFSILKQQGFDQWHYTVIGGGSEEKMLRRLATYLKLDRYVTFVGACQHNKVYSYLNNADVFTLPSYKEAFGIANLEAMALGLLTLGVKGQGVEAFIKHNKTGLLVNPQDPHHLAQTFKTIFEQKEKMQRIAQEGKIFSRENFTWEKHAEKLIAVYREVASERMKVEACV